jgi:hypothetical protein
MTEEHEQKPPNSPSVEQRAALFIDPEGYRRVINEVESSYVKQLEQEKSMKR